MPPRCGSARSSPSTRVRRHPRIVPSLVAGRPDPDRADPARSRAPTSPTSTSSPTRSATCSISSPARCPASAVAYWGPEIKVGMPQPALNVNMDALTNVESLSFQLRRRATRRCRSSSSRTESTQVPIPIPIPTVTPLNPPLGAHAADADAASNGSTDTGEARRPAQALMLRHGARLGAVADAVDGHRHARRAALRAAC